MLIVITMFEQRAWLTRSALIILITAAGDQTIRAVTIFAKHWSMYSKKRTAHLKDPKKRLAIRASRIGRDGTTLRTKRCGLTGCDEHTTAASESWSRLQ